MDWFRINNFEYYVSPNQVNWYQVLDLGYEQADLLPIRTMQRIPLDGDTTWQDIFDNTYRVWTGTKVKCSVQATMIYDGKGITFEKWDKTFNANLFLRRPV